MPKVGLIFPFWTPNFVVWTPHFGWDSTLTLYCAWSNSPFEEHRRKLRMDLDRIFWV